MKPRFVAILQALFVVFLWATSWVLIKIGLKDIPPLVFAGLRYFLAFIGLLVALGFSEAKKELKTIQHPEWSRLVLLGLLFYAGTQGASFLALFYLPAVTVNLLWSFSSVIIALLGILWLSETPTWLQWGGIGLAMAGAIIYFYPASIQHGQLVGILVAVVGILANSASAILGRSINRAQKYHPLVVTVVSMGVGSVVLLVSGVLLEGFPSISPTGWVIIAWLAFINTAFAFTLWNLTLRTLSAIESSIINSTMMIWIPVFAVLFLGESISVKQVIGLLAAGLGTLVVQLRRLPLASRTGWRTRVPR